MYFCLLFLPPINQLVQAEILQSDVQSKSDNSPVTVADYGNFTLHCIYLSVCLFVCPDLSVILIFIQVHKLL
jgi:hypothetical protein